MHTFKGVMMIVGEQCPVCSRGMLVLRVIESRLLAPAMYVLWLTRSTTNSGTIMYRALAPFGTFFAAVFGEVMLDLEKTLLPDAITAMTGGVWAMDGFSMSKAKVYVVSLSPWSINVSGVDAWAFYSPVIVTIELLEAARLESATRVTEILFFPLAIGLLCPISFLVNCEEWSWVV
jgi:hypothetical protein